MSELDFSIAWFRDKKRKRSYRWVRDKSIQIYEAGRRIIFAWHPRKGFAYFGIRPRGRWFRFWKHRGYAWRLNYASA